MSNTLILNGAGLNGDIPVVTEPPPATIDVFYGGRLNGTRLNNVQINGRTYVEEEVPPNTIQVFYGGEVNGLPLNTRTLNGRVYIEQEVPDEIIVRTSGMVNGVELNGISVNGFGLTELTPPPVADTVNFGFRALYDLEFPVEQEFRARYSFQLEGNRTFQFRSRYAVLGGPTTQDDFRVRYTYDVEGSSTFEFRALYDIDLVPLPLTEFRARYLWEQQGNFTAPYPLIFRMSYDVFEGQTNFDFRARWADGFQFDFRSVYEIREQKQFEFRQRYDILDYDPFQTDFRATYEMSRVQFEFRAEFNYLQSFANDFRARYSIEDFETIQQEFRAPYSMAGTTFEFRSTYDIRGPVNYDFRASWNMTENLQQEFRAEYDLLTYDPFERGFTARWNIIEPIVIDITGQPIVTIIGSGIVVEVTSADVSCSEGSPHWTATIVLGDMADYALFNQDDRIELNLFGELYDFIVDSKELTRGGPVDRSAVLNCVSLAALSDTPRAEASEVVFDTNTSLITMLTDTLALAGSTITQIGTITDGTVPAFRQGARSTTPLRLASQIAEAAGLRLEASRVGNDFRLRRWWPERTSNFGNSTPVDFEWNDIDDIMRLRESLTPQRVIDRIRLYDSQSQFNDRITFELNVDENGVQNPLEGTVKVYLSPYRSFLGLADPILSNLNTSNVSLSGGGLVIETISEEEVQFSVGVGNTSFPVDSIDTVDWIGSSLGGVTFEQGSTTIRGTNIAANCGYALAKVTYRTRTLVYTASSTQFEETDLLLLTQAFGP